MSPSSIISTSWTSPAAAAELLIRPLPLPTRYRISATALTDISAPIPSGAGEQRYILSNFNNMLRVSRPYRLILFHCFIWSALVCSVLLMGPHSAETRPVSWTGIQIIWAIIPCIGLFYVHAYWLMPVYLFRKKKMIYFTAVIIAVLAAAMLSALSFYLGSHPPGHFYY